MDSSYTRTGLSVLSNDGSDAVSAYRTSIRNLAAWAEANAALRGQDLLSARPAAGKAGTFYKATDAAPGVLYYDNGATWEAIGAAPPTDGSASTPSLRTLGSGSTQAAAGSHSHGGFMTALYVTKSSSTIRLGTTSMSDDPDLALTLAASGTYRVTVRLIYAASDPPKMKMNFRRGGGVSIQSWFILNSTLTGAAQHGTNADVVTYGQGTGNSLGDAYSSIMHEVIVTTATSGPYDFALQWAANTSGGSTCVVYDRSYLIAEKIA